MSEKSIELKEAPVGKLILKYSVPAIIGMMVNALYNVIDRIFIGNIPGIGQLAMAGLGVTLPMMSIINAFGMLIAVGGATSISLAQGAGDHKKVEKILGNVITLGFLVGISITIIGIVFSEPILALFGGSEQSIPYAQAYIDIILCGCVFSLFGSTFNYLIRGDGNPRFSAMIMIIGCVLNIILDATFIYGFNMGIKGAATATIISQFTTSSIGFSYYFRGKSNIKLHLKNLKIEWKYVKAVLMIGVSPFAMQLTSSTVQVMANNRLSTYGGDLAIGAMATIASILTVIAMPIVGLATGMQPIVSYNFGAKQYDRAEKALKIGYTVSITILIIQWVITRVYPEQIVGIFNNDPELLAATLDGMQKYLLLFPLMAITYIGSNFIQSIGKAKTALILGLLRQVIFLAPLFWILPQFFGLDGVWYSQPTADVMSTTVTTTVVAFTIKSYRKKAESIE